MRSIYDDIEEILQKTESLQLVELVKQLRDTRPSVSTLEVRAAIIALWEADKVEVVNGESVKAKHCRQPAAVG